MYHAPVLLFLQFTYSFLPDDMSTIAPFITTEVTGEDYSSLLNSVFNSEQQENGDSYPVSSAEVDDPFFDSETTARPAIPFGPPPSEFSDCSECVTGFNDIHRLQLHLLKHAKQKSSNPEKAYPKAAQRIFVKARKQKPIKRNYTCPVCGRTFKQNSVYDKHLEEHIITPSWYKKDREKRIFPPRKRTKPQSEEKAHQVAFSKKDTSEIPSNQSDLPMPTCPPAKKGRPRKDPCKIAERLESPQPKKDTLQTPFKMDSSILAPPSNNDTAVTLPSRIYIPISLAEHTSSGVPLGCQGQEYDASTTPSTQKLFLVFQLSEESLRQKDASLTYVSSEVVNTPQNNSPLITVKKPLNTVAPSTQKGSTPESGTSNSVTIQGGILPPKNAVSIPCNAPNICANSQIRKDRIQQDSEDDSEIEGSSHRMNGGDARLSETQEIETMPTSIPEQFPQDKDSIFVCQQCDALFHNPNTLVKHISSAHGEEDEEMTCKGCGELFHTYNLFVNHIYPSCPRTKNRILKCKQCPMVFTNGRELSYHLSSHANYSCPVCFKDFPCLTDVVKHKTTVHKDGMKRPPKPAKKTPRVVPSTKPRKPRKDKGPSMYLCDICGYTAKYGYAMKKHLTIHTGIKKFACDMCPRTFRTNTSLVVHKRRHTGEKPFICHQCPKTFATSSCLTVHLRFHDDVRPYTCDICERAFHTPQNMRTHRERHSKQNVVRKHTNTLPQEEEVTNLLSNLNANFWF